MSLKGKLFYIFLTSIFAIIVINKKEYFLLVAFLPFLIFIIKKFSFKYCGVLVLVFAFFSIYRVNSVNVNLNQQQFQETFIVKESKETYVFLKRDNEKYIMYLKDKESYDVNDKLYIVGKYELIEKDLDIDVFDFKDYLNNNRIHYQIIAYKIELLKSSTPLNMKIVSFL